LEGPWVKADHAFDVVAQGVPRGKAVFSVISSYDDIRFFVEKAPGYEPGDTLMLVAPLLIAHGVDGAFLHAVARAPRNTSLVPGATDAISYIKGFDSFYLISTSYEQYVEQAAGLLGVGRDNIFCTKFPIDRLSSSVKEEDKELVRTWTRRIASMPVIEVDESGTVAEGCRAAKEELDHFFWEVLPETSFSQVMEQVRPVGGGRKYSALLEALSREAKSLDEATVVGDSITDSVMLSKTREAGGLALSFNGNRYSLTSSNVAIISGNCWITAAIAEIFKRGGLDAIRRAAETWGPSSFEELRSSGLLSADISRKLSSAFPTSESLPRVFWLGSEKLEPIIRESEKFRSQLRGLSIGRLG